MRLTKRSVVKCHPCTQPKQPSVALLRWSLETLTYTSCAKSITVLSESSILCNSIKAFSLNSLFLANTTVLGGCCQKAHGPQVTKQPRHRPRVCRYLFGGHVWGDRGNAAPFATVGRYIIVSWAHASTLLGIMWMRRNNFFWIEYLKANELYLQFFYLFYILLHHEYNFFETIITL